VNRLLLIALCAAIVVAVASPAGAYWRAAGSGTGAGTSATMPAGSTPAVTASAEGVTVSWPQSAFQGAPLGGYPGGGYAVTRYAEGGASGGAAACSPTVGGLGATLRCLDTEVPYGRWQYTVTPVLNSFTGDESARSATVAVASPAPTLTAVVAQNPPTDQAVGPIQITWGAVPGATGYNVYRRTASGSYDFSRPLNAAPITQATTYNDPGSGLTSETTYAYVVRALAGSPAVESASSAERSTTAIARPAAPGGVAAAPRAAGRIDVAWSGVAAADGYNVYRRTVAGAYDLTAPLNGSTPVSTTTFSDTTARDGTTYVYAVRSVTTGAGGAPVESASSADSAAVTADGLPPSAVTLTDPGSPLRGTVALAGGALDSGSGVASLRFQYATAGGSGWSDACTATAAPYSCSLATAALADGLYDVRVVATDVAGNATTSGVVAARRVDNTGPSVTMSDPGGFLRATVTLTATAGDAGSGLATLRIQRAPTGSGAWADVCTVTSSPAGCALNTAALADGGYDLRAIATDAAGNAAASAAVVNRVVDNTAPGGVDVQTTNGSGTAGRPDTGDVLAYTFSEPMRPASILAGWTGAATPVVVRFTKGNPDVITVYDATNTTPLALGSVTSGKKYVTANTTFTGSSMVLSGNTIAVTFGTPSGATAVANGTGTLQWTTSTAATDRAGNPLKAGTVAETGVLDIDF
jgi:chitinase